MNPQFVIATYEVAEQNQQEFISLLHETEKVMRDEQLITSKTISRMSSIMNPKIIIEVFEWVDSEAFDRAQKNPAVLNMWGKYENLWERGGFGMNEVPESNQPWSQFKSID